MDLQAATIGFGEAARAFAADWPSGAPLKTFDIKVADPAERDGLLSACEAHGVRCCPTPAAALDGAEVVLSLVTAGFALPAARAAAEQLKPGALWCDMNSVSPDTKRAAAAAV